jgi:hypothetical protein
VAGRPLFGCASRVGRSVPILPLVVINV